MYCTYCNHKNAEENKFCEKCGKSLVISEPPKISELQKVSEPPKVSVPPTVSSAQQTPRRSKTSWARRLASIGSGIVLYCFFLPWLLVSCSLDIDQRSGVEITGYEIASGDFQITDEFNQLANFYGTAPYSPSSADSSYPLVAIIPLIGAIGLLALNGRISGSVVAILTGLLGIAGMVFFTIIAVALGNELNRSMLLDLNFRAGYWGTWFGFLWQLVVAIMTVRQRK
jgi:hypothetical protein